MTHQTIRSIGLCQKHTLLDSPSRLAKKFHGCRLYRLKSKWVTCLKKKLFPYHPCMVHMCLHRLMVNVGKYSLPMECPKVLFQRNDPYCDIPLESFTCPSFSTGGYVSFFLQGSQKKNEPGGELYRLLRFYVPLRNNDKKSKTTSCGNQQFRPPAL